MKAQHSKTNKIFFDLDETLIHTCASNPEQDHIFFYLDGDEELYQTIIRPCAKSLIKFAQQSVGEKNVYILTASVQEYAEKINELGELGVLKEKIIAREKIQGNYSRVAWGGGCTLPMEGVANENNILIDNLPPRYNEDKIQLIGISKTYLTNYLQVRDYWGVNFPNDPFENEVKEFIKNRTR
jgi:hypothetical protein